MTEIYLPVSLRQARSSFKYIDSTGVTRGAYTGNPQTTNYGGDRIGATIDFTSMGGKTAAELSLRRQLLSTLMQLRGKTNRIYLRDNSYVQGGSFPAPELFLNTEFSTTINWAASGGGTLTVSDGVARLTVNAVGSTPQFAQSVTLAAYTPYVLRSIILDGAQTSGLSIGPFMGDAGSITANGYSTSRGYLSASIVAATAGAGAGYPAVLAAASGYTAGAYVAVPFASLSRCALVDGGGTLTLRSRELDNAAWTKTALLTVTANTEIAPDGTMTGEALIPTVTNTSHLISQAVTVTSTAQDLNIRGCFKAGGYNFVLLAMTEATGATQSFQTFNLLTGAVGTTTATGGNWSNLRAAIVSLGNGWYYCSLIVRKTNAATSITGAAYAESTDSGSGFAGNGTSFVAVSDIDLSPSSSHARITTSTSAAVAASTQTGIAIYIKGLPASTSGLLLAGDQFEIDGQIKFLTAPLDSDAAGGGYLQFSPPLRRAVSDNTPVIICKPMGRFMLAGDSGWANEPGVFSTAALDLEEAFG